MAQAMRQLEPKPPVIKNPLAYVAVWQSMGFLILICLVWVNVVVDFAQIFYGRPGAPLDWVQASIITAGIIVVGFITVGHTYVQEKRVLRGFIIVCSYCHKVQIEDQAWQQMEVFVSDHSMAEFTHGVCPHCYEKVSRQIDAVQMPKN